MKKPKPPLPDELRHLQNPVAKFMHRFNKAQTHGDKNRYRRNNKHKNAEPFAMHVPHALQRAPALSGAARPAAAGPKLS